MTKPLASPAHRNTRALTDDQVRTLRACRQPDGRFVGISRLAAAFGVGLSTAQQAATGITYREVPVLAPPPVVEIGPDPRVMECRAARAQKVERERVRYADLMALARRRFAVVMGEHGRRGRGFVQVEGRV